MYLTMSLVIRSPHLTNAIIIVEITFVLLFEMSKENLFAKWYWSLIRIDLKIRWRKSRNENANVTGIILVPIINLECYFEIILALQKCNAVLTSTVIITRSYLSSKIKKKLMTSCFRFSKLSAINIAITEITRFAGDWHAT